MKFNMALCQMTGSFSKEKNIEKAGSFIKKAAEGAQIVALPEMWNCPYGNQFFRKYAEDESGPSVEFLSCAARENDVYLIGGSIPELSDGKVYNTAFCFGRNGELLARHRKAHLFDVDVEGGISFKESDTLTAGDSVTLMDTEYCRIGVAICYDVRFPELFRRMALDGAKLIVLPAAFSKKTGEGHWDVSMRARAIDNQVYMAAVSPARDEKGVYVAYGHSCIIDPWGTPVASTGTEESIVRGEIDMDHLESIRNQLPLLKHRREELY